MTSVQEANVTNDEVKFFTILATAKKAGDEAIKDWDINDWFPCGNSCVLVKPRNSKFAHWLVREGYGRDAPYLKAVVISPPNHTNQAMNPKQRWSSIVAEVLRKNDIRVDTWTYID